jgi:hypothetical protein
MLVRRTSVYVMVPVALLGVLFARCIVRTVRPKGKTMTSSRWIGGQRAYR